MAVARDRINMPPTISFTGPQEAFAVVNPFSIAAGQSSLVPIDVAPGNVNPGIILFHQHWTYFAGANVAQHESVVVLQTIQLLNDDLVRIRGPFHARQVVVARVTGNIEPTSGAAGCGYHPDARGGICLARLRIREGSDDGIETGRIVNEQHFLHAVSVELPVSNVLTVGTPAEAVPAEQLFFIDPIEGAIHHISRAVSCQLRDLRIVAEAFNIDIILADIAHACSVRRELGKHQRRRFS